MSHDCIFEYQHGLGERHGWPRGMYAVRCRCHDDAFQVIKDGADKAYRCPDSGAVAEYTAVWVEAARKNGKSSWLKGMTS